jgi:hypothetical protein
MATISVANLGQRNVIVRENWVENHLWLRYRKGSRLSGLIETLNSSFGTLTRT